MCATMRVCADARRRCPYVVVTIITVTSLEQFTSSQSSGLRLSVRFRLGAFGPLKCIPYTEQQLDMYWNV